MPATPKAVQADKEQLKQVLVLLQATTKQCAERKEQIATLVSALIPTKDTPDSA